MFLYLHITEFKSVTVGQMLHYKPSDFSETSGVSEDNDGFNLMCSDG